MKTRSITFLIVNILFFAFNVFIVTQIFKWSGKVRDYEDGIRGREAEQVVHEFINKSRLSKINLSLIIQQGRFSYEPIVIRRPYDIKLIDYYEPFFWFFDIQFEGGGRYQAEVGGNRNEKLVLREFELVEPRKWVTIRTKLRILVRHAHKHMFHFNLSEVNYNDLVKANVFKRFRQPFHDSVSEWVDLSSFKINESDTKVEIIMYNGQVVSYEFDSLIEQVEKGVRFHL